MDIDDEKLKVVQKYLDFIGEKLWENKGIEPGRVSLMIGAGFSKNANKFYPKSKSEFPLWSDLTHLLQEKLKCTCKDPDPLELAYEYEKNFGRQALNEFLMQNIPDKDYVPSNLHKLLLNLPWSDVFTTNYDTLLERTLPEIYNRKYNCIITINEIATTKKPRIVKLHGSFPSTFPYIITKEDYKEYPKKYAPFVNMVQQSLMENTFCLIGFSGNDPNFKKWIEWVNSNMGSSMPKIYLIGNLNDSECKSEYLEQSNIIPVNLSVIDSDPHKAIECFLWYLVEKRPINPLEWPFNKRSAFVYDLESSNSCKNILPWNTSNDSNVIIIEQEQTKFFNFPLSNINENNLQKSLNELNDRYKKWKKERESFPGWIVLHEKNKINLEESTKNWLHYILYYIRQFNGKMEKYFDLELLYELNWRIEKLLWPLDNELLETYEMVVKNYMNDLDGMQESEIVQELITITFSIMRKYREELNRKKFYEWIKLIEDHIKPDSEWNSKLHYEKIIFEIGILDIDKAIELIEKWPENFDYLEWELRRASLLSEVGKFNEARKVAGKVLDKVHSFQNKEKEDIYLLSLEGWSILFLNVLGILPSLNDKDKDKQKEYFEEYSSDRLNRLNLYNSDSNTIFDQLRYKIHSFKIRKKQETKKSFDPGIINIVHHFYSLDIYHDDHILNAYQFLRMVEESGYPANGSTHIWTNIVMDAAESIRPLNYLQAFSLYIRTVGHSEQEIDNWFDRITVVTLNEETLNKIVSIIIPAWKQTAKHIINDNLMNNNNDNFLSYTYIRLFKTLSELISRLLFRFDNKLLNEIFDLSLKYYKSDNILWMAREEMFNLFKRLFFTMSEELLLDKMDELLVLPIPGQDGKFAQDQAQTQGMKWPEPFYFIFDQLNSLPANFDRSSWDKPIDELIKKIENHETHSEIRKIAILRLITIQKINGLTEEELHKFAGALISNKIENTNLPKNVRLFDFRYLRFIDKLQEELRIFLKNWLLETPIIDYYDSNHWWNSNLLVNCIEDLTNKERQFYFDEYCQILTLSSEFLAVKINNRNSQYLTNDDLIKILEKVIDWERKFVNYYNTLSSSPLGVNKYEYYKEYFVWILEIMNKIIYPNVNLNDLNINKIYELSNQVLALLSSVNIEILSALPGMLILGKECLYETKKKLQEGLISSNIETVFQSIEGVLYWTYYSKSIENFPKLDDDLLGGIIDKVYSRKQPILDIAISSLASIIEMYPDLINDEKSNKICSALKYLFEDTEIPILKQYEEAVMDIYKPFDLEDILKYRKVASDLAFSMKEWYESKKFDQKEIISKWEQRSVKDKLPEIRKKWENSQNG